MSKREIHISLGYKCNCRCKHCVVQVKRGKLEAAGKERMNLSGNEAAQLLRTVADKGADTVVISGGEPTMRHDLADHVMYLLRRGIKVNIQTNGTNTSEIERLLTSCAGHIGNLSFMIPLHAAEPETHDYISDNSGGFTSVMKTLTLLREKNAAVDGKIIFTKLTNDLERIVAIFKAYKARRVIIAYPHCVGFSDEMVRDIAIEIEELYGKLNFIKHMDGVNIYLQGFPHCGVYDMSGLLQDSDSSYLETEIIELKYKDPFEYRWHDFRKKDKRKFSGCSLCARNDDCEGIWKEYIRVFGDRSEPLLIP